jgi:glycosyltransferase involved in cell wall biosynthesis
MSAGLRPSYRVIGFVGSELGIGVAAGNAVRALQASGRAVARRPILARSVRPAGSGDSPEPVPGPPSLNLFHLNPLDIARSASQWRDFVDPLAPNVCVPYWELPLLPRVWVPLLDAMDAVLAPTRFIAEACERSLAHSKIIHFPQAVFIPEVHPAREEWGFLPGETVFLVSFDLGSDIERKNPWAAIDAFQRAFPSTQGVRLVVKTKPWRVHAYQFQAAELRQRTAGDRRIQIVDRSLTYPEVLGLYASCDVLLSLHRSEGLGLHLMEAMSLRKAVVATDWSGSSDFVSPEHAFPIKYRLVPVRTAHPAYSPEVGRQGQVWAEPDVNDAVEALRALHGDRARREGLGAAAASHMEDRRATMLSGSPFDALETELSGRPGDAPKLRRALRRARPDLLLMDLRAIWRDVADHLRRGTSRAPPARG